MHTPHRHSPCPEHSIPLGPVLAGEGRGGEGRGGEGRGGEWRGGEGRGGVGSGGEGRGGEGRGGGGVEGRGGVEWGGGDLYIRKCTQCSHVAIATYGQVSASEVVWSTGQEQLTPALEERVREQSKKNVRFMPASPSVAQVVSCNV